jgi:hypothetical protein
MAVKVPEQFKAPEVVIIAPEIEQPVAEAPVPRGPMEYRQRSIWDKLKDSIYEIFKEEDDTELK